MKSWYGIVSIRVADSNVPPLLNSPNGDSVAGLPYFDDDEAVY